MGDEGWEKTSCFHISKQKPVNPAYAVNPVNLNISSESFMNPRTPAGFAMPGGKPSVSCRPLFVTFARFY